MSKLSIITINRNNAEGLRKTMESVFAQTYRDFEYIVVDGNSTDDSVDVIKEYEEQLHLTHSTIHFKWISEPDTGIYSAMNKGVKMSHGEYTLMLNSGDYLVDEHVIERIIPELDGTDIIQGNNIENRGGQLVRNRGYGKSNIDISDIMKGFFLHQASFCRLDLFKKYGFFDESYKVGADTKFFMNCIGVHNASFRYVDVDICNYDMTGISSEQSEQWIERRKLELERLRRELFPDKMISFVFDNDKKIRLYDMMHAHRWSWSIVMAFAHLVHIVHRNSE